MTGGKCPRGYVAYGSKCLGVYDRGLSVREIGGLLPLQTTGVATQLLKIKDQYESVVSL